MFFSHSLTITRHACFLQAATIATRRIRKNVPTALLIVACSYLFGIFFFQPQKFHNETVGLIKKCHSSSQILCLGHCKNFVRLWQGMIKFHSCGSWIKCNQIFLGAWAGAQRDVFSCLRQIAPLHISSKIWLLLDTGHEMCWTSRSTCILNLRLC